MNRLLLINTPQNDYAKALSARATLDQIRKRCLEDKEFMSSVYVIGVIVDFYPIINEHIDENQSRCFSFTHGAGIVEDISDNIHFSQTCSIKKLPKNDGEKYERTVFNSPDSGMFLINLLNPMRSSDDTIIDEVYLCGLSIDGSLMETVRQLSEFYPSNNIHLISDLIWTENQSEVFEIGAFAEANNIPSHQFRK